MNKLTDIFLEDQELGKAVKEGRNDDFVDEQNIFFILDDKAIKGWKKDER